MVLTEQHVEHFLSVWANRASYAKYE